MERETLKIVVSLSGNYTKTTTPASPKNALLQTVFLVSLPTGRLDWSAPL